MGKFEETFGVSKAKFADRLMMWVTGKYVLDIIKFDEWLHDTQGYTEEKDGSINNFVEKKWGKEAVKLINSDL